MDLSVNHFKDTLPYDRSKDIHSIGGVAKAVWKSVGNHSYTGLFQGETAAMVRMSSATDISELGFKPGIGVKLFRDGMPSANFVAMKSLENQQSGNFFEQDFSNHIPPPGLNPILLWLGFRFEQASPPALMVGLSDIASYDQTGAKVDFASFPYNLTLVPNIELTERFQNATLADVAENLEEMLSTISSGTKLWDVYALSDPDPDSFQYEKIAELETSSEIVFSLASDNFLFFRHQKMLDDLALRSEWEDYMPEPVIEYIFSSVFGASRCPGLRGLL